MKRVRELEGVLLRIEGGAVVVIVLLMLTLAGYNVVYRNVLVPLQSHWAHSGPPLTDAQKQEAAEAKAAEKKAAAKAEGGAAEPAGESEGDGAEGFGGAFGKAAGEEEEEDEEKKAPEPDPDAEDGESDDAGGFGGAFGKKAPEPEADDPEDPEDDPDADLDAQFENLPDIDRSRAEDASGPQGGPPPEGSFAAWAVQFIGKLNLDWIDVLLRQLVIIASFLGAALATARGKHINVDALSKILPRALQRWAGVATNALALGVCCVLASAGHKLVNISREFPAEVTPFADEWHFQLMFPFGFGLLALHFLVRIGEGLVGLPPPGEEPAPAPAPAPAPDEEDDA